MGGGMVRTAVLICAALSLAACDSLPQTWSRDDIEAIAYNAAEDVADASVPDAPGLESRISDLESKVSYLESKVSDLEAENASLRAEIANAEAQIANLAVNSY